MYFFHQKQKKVGFCLEHLFFIENKIDVFYFI